MAITIKTEPADYSTGYSAIPLRVLSDDTISENLKYLINITYDEFEYLSSEVVSFNNQVYTKITTTTDHDYTVGDIVLFYNPVTESYTDTYTVMGVTDTDEFIINLTLGAPIVATSTSYFYKIIPYTMLPDEQYEAKLDLSNTIKDFVTQNFEDTGEIFEAPNTRFDYGLTIGTEYKYIYEFTDNLFVTGGTVAFINPSLTSGDVDDSPFKIGDQITIQQELHEWVYDDNGFDVGDLTFNSATIDHGFSVGDEIQVTGQITEPSYNGATTITEIIDVKTIKVNKGFVASTPAEGGIIFGVITPSYNTTANITDIYWDATDGFVLETDIAYTSATPAIGGQVKFADNRTTQNYIEQKVDDLIAYSSAYTQDQYVFNGGDFDSYVVQTRALDENNISTILTQLGGKNTRFRIEPSTKSWLLARTDGLTPTAGVIVTFFDVDSNLLCQLTINNANLYDDFYFPIGIDSIIINSDTTLLAGSALSTVRDDVAFYGLAMAQGSTTASNPLWFEINTDCSSYELYHLCWKDAFGSWLSYPFKYIERNVTEFERKNYYQKEGRFDLDTDAFGYDSFGRGDTTYFNRSRDKILLTSGWIAEFENDIIKDLLGSSNVMVQLPDGTMKGCIMETTKQEFRKNNVDAVFNYKMEVRLANNNTRK